MDEEQAVHALTVLVRLSRREQDTAQWIDRAVRSDPARMVVPAIRVAIESGEPMGTVLVGVLSDTALPTEVLLAAHASIPPYTTVLGQAAALIAEKLLAVPADELPATLRAELLANHAERLLENGQIDRALPTAHEAVAAGYAHASTAPTVLLNARRVLAACQVRAGDVQGAMETAEQTLGLIRLLGIDSGLTLADARYSLGLRVMSLGEHERALGHFELVVGACEAELQSTKASRVGPVYRMLALASLQAATALQFLERLPESFAHAWKASTILRDLADEQPDAYETTYAQALMLTGKSVSKAQPSSHDVEQAQTLVSDKFIWMLDRLIQDAARNHDIETLADWVKALTSASEHFDPDDAVDILNHLAAYGISLVQREHCPEALVILKSAVAAAQPLAATSAKARSLLVRALSGLSRAQSVDDEPPPDTTATDSNERAIHSAAQAVASAAGGNHLERAAASSGLSLRLEASGRLEDAFRASKDAVQALFEEYEPTRPDQVYAAAGMTYRLLHLAERTNALAKVDDQTLEASIALLTGFTGHRAGDIVIEWLAQIGFMAINAYSRRGNALGVARAHRAVIGLAKAYPNVAVATRSRTLGALNAIQAHVRAFDLQLADEAFADICTVAADQPGDEILVQQAMCANVLLNLYIDVDIARAAEVVRAAESALRSSVYLAALPELGDNDPDSYGQWLDRILAAAAGELPTMTQEELAAAEADCVTTVARYRDRYGDDGPAVMSATQKLAAILWAQGRFDAADDQLLTVVESLRRRLGNDHPETITAVETRTQIQAEIARLQSHTAR